MKITTVQSIDVDDWDNLVEKTYGKIYNFQQQDGCKDRGIAHIRVPCQDPYDYEKETLDRDNDEMGVSFAAWLAAKTPSRSNWRAEMFWERNFYPNIDMIVNDLHAKGLLPAGDYQIVIDW